MDTIIVTTPWGSLEGFTGDLITDQLSAFGAHQRSDLALLLSLLRPGDIVIDVGAHIGTYTIPIARAVGPAGTVIAIEPVEEHYALLRRNLERNGLVTRVQTIPALAGEATAFLGATSGNTGSARFGRGGGDVKVVVPSVQLDDIAPTGVALVKIDVEGMELEVLQSARRMLERDRPIFIFETGSGSDPHYLGKEFARLDYSFIVNLHERGGEDDVFEAGRLPSLSPPSLTSRLISPLPLLDIVAIPSESDRRLNAVRSAFHTSAVLFARRARIALGRLRRSIWLGAHHTCICPAALVSYIDARRRW